MNAIDSEVEKVMRERGWRPSDYPPLPQAIGIMIDLLEGHAKTQQDLRQENLELKRRLGEET